MAHGSDSPTSAADELEFLLLFGHSCKGFSHPVFHEALDDATDSQVAIRVRDDAVRTCSRWEVSFEVFLAERRTHSGNDGIADGVVEGRMPPS